MARKSRLQEAGRVDAAKQPDATETYDLDDHNQFNVPWAGTFQLNHEKSCVELVSRHFSIAGPLLTRINDPNFISRGLLGAMNRPDTQFLVSREFENLENLHANVPKIAQLSKRIEKFGNAKPLFVLGFPDKGGDDAITKFDHVKAALADHGVDAHVVMMPTPAAGGNT